MNSVPKKGAKKPTSQRDLSKKLKIEISHRMERELNAFYREVAPNLSSDSGESSRQNSVCNDLDYQTSIEDAQGDRCGHQNSRDEIADQLAKLKIGYNQNLRGDFRVSHDVIPEEDIKSHSIIAGNSPADSINHNSIPSIADSRYSIILAGRLNSKDDLFTLPDERSLLNIAINESVQTNTENLSNNAELSHFVDSLDVQREEVSSSGLNDKDSLEEGDYCAGKKWGNQKALINLSENDENVDPNSSEPRRRGQPMIISNETFHSPIKISKSSAKKISVTADSEECGFDEPVSKYKIYNVKQRSNHSDLNEDRFNSSMTDSERLVIADIRTPNRHFIEDCCKSSPMVEVNADTFGSNFVADISIWSTLGNGNIERDGKNEDIDRSRDRIFKRFSQQFAEAPIKFTEKLLILFEESILGSSKAGNPDGSDVSFSRLTEEFRKICRVNSKKIEDESMPDSVFGPSFNVTTPTLAGVSISAQEAADLQLQNFSKLGGGKKVYRKTPRRIFKANGVTHCSTPNCANVSHRAKNNNLHESDYRSPNGGNDSTATFEFWENFCYEMSPNKQGTKSSLLHAENLDLPMCEDIIRKSSEQMVALNRNSTINLDSDKEETSDSNKRNLTTTSKDCQDHSNSMRQKFIEDLSLSLVNGSNKSNSNFTELYRECNYNEIQQLLTAGLVEKRRKCFEEAQRVFDNKQSNTLGKNGESLDKILELIDENESSRERDDEARFLSTLSACVDYFDHVKTLQSHRNSLQCILECSEDSESVKNNTNDSRSMKFVQAVILPAQNRAKYGIKNQEIQKPGSSPKNVNLIAQTSLYLPGTPGISNEKSSSKSQRARSRLSPIHRHSPGAHSSSVLSKKIKSPISPVRRRNIRAAAKPASPACVLRTPTMTPEGHVSSGNKQNSLSSRSGMKSTPRFQSNYKMKAGTNSPGLMDVTNTKKRFEVPKLIITKPTPSCDSPKTISGCFKIADENMASDSQRKLYFSETETPELKSSKYFFTPGKTPTYGKVKPKKKYFETPKGQPLQNKWPANSPGSYRVNYNTVQSPVGMYIRGTDPNLITNVKGKTNERMLTPHAKTPNSKSKVASPILARSPCLSPKSTETSRLKFQLTPARRQKQNQDDIFNIALCESDPSSNIGSESTSHSPFPKIFYKPAPCVKMVNDNVPQRRCPKVFAKGTEEKIIYRHKGRFKSGTESKVPNFSVDGSTKDSLSYDLGDISLLHQRPAAKSNYLLKK